ncbi:MAG: hypothetical protein ACO2O0_13860 [Desulfurococcales archaeon]
MSNPGAGSTSDMIVSGLLTIYNWLVNIITTILQQTIIKDNPDIAREYGSALALLISVTAIYLLLVLVSAFKKILGVIIAIGWLAIIIAIMLRIVSPK